MTRSRLEDKRFAESMRLHAAASVITSGGVHSDARRLEVPVPLFIESGRGSRILDVDGNQYIDYVMGQGGTLLLGHAPEVVGEAVVRQLERGALFGGQTALEVELAGRLLEIIPAAERLRFGVTGSEAVHAAVRIARAATGRSLLVKFQGHYHGWLDSLYYKADVANPPSAPFGVAEAPGMPDGGGSDVLVAAWGDVGALEQVMEAYGENIAAVILEAVPVSYPVPPPEGYLETVRKLCDQTGSLLIFDEVVTGFRLGLGGAQERFGVDADLAVFGKALACGLPLACITGTADLFDWAERGETLHKGTFNGNPLSLAAGLAVIETLSDNGGHGYERFEATAARLLGVFEQKLSGTDKRFRVTGLPELFRVHAADDGDLTAIRAELVRHGVRIAWNGSVFPSFAHSDEDVTETAERLGEALDRVQSQ